MRKILAFSAFLTTAVFAECKGYAQSQDFNEASTSMRVGVEAREVVPLELVKLNDLRFGTVSYEITDPQLVATHGFRPEITSYDSQTRSFECSGPLESTNLNRQVRGDWGPAKLYISGNENTGVRISFVGVNEGEDAPNMVLENINDAEDVVPVQVIISTASLYSNTLSSYTWPELTAREMYINRHEPSGGAEGYGTIPMCFGGIITLDSDNVGGVYQGSFTINISYI